MTTSLRRRLNALTLPHSLVGRLTLASLCLLPLILGATGAMLDRAYLSSLLAGEQERLRLHVYLLLGEIEFEGDRPLLPERFSNPLLNRQNSGLYAYVLDAEGQELWRSRSATLQPVRARASASSDNGFSYAPSSGLLALAFPVIWEDIGGNDLPITMLIQRSDEPLRATLQAYRTRLWQWLGALGGTLVLCQLLVLRWGLIPLRQVAHDIATIESGDTRILQGPYPAEIMPLTQNLNLLLQSEQQQRERYHNTMSDLAHSLKTPLAILHGLEDRGELPAAAAEPLHRMAAIIEHQLQRASRAVSHRMTQSIAVASTLDRLLASLNKVYHGAPKTVAICGERTLRFRGDERDLMEILGNLLDNAYKYGDEQITVELARAGADISIDIHDDGPGISPSQTGELLKRGQRGDCSIAGQGIGLAVVCDIVDAYGGQLAIARSASLGGAQIHLTLPH